MIRDDGGSAFPYRHEWQNDFKGYTEVEASEGMTLRDWFAGQALIGILASGEMPTEPWADKAYAIADAMLKARETA